MVATGKKKQYLKKNNNKKKKPKILAKLIELLRFLKNDCHLYGKWK